MILFAFVHLWIVVVKKGKKPFTLRILARESELGTFNWLHGVTWHDFSQSDGAKMGPRNDVKVFDLWSLSVKDQILKTKKQQQIFFYQHKKIFDPKRHRVTFLKQKNCGKAAAYDSFFWQLLVTAASDSWCSRRPKSRGSNFLPKICGKLGWLQRSRKWRPWSKEALIQVLILK